MEEGELGLSGSAGEQFPKHLLHLLQRDPRTNLDSNTIYLLIFRRTPIATCANAQKTRELHAGGVLKVEKTGHQKQQHLDIQFQRITEFSMKRTNIIDCIIDMRKWYRIWPANGYRLIRAETRLHKIRRTVCSDACFQRASLRGSSH